MDVGFRAGYTPDLAKMQRNAVVNGGVVGARVALLDAALQFQRGGQRLAGGGQGGEETVARAFQEALAVLAQNGVGDLHQPGFKVQGEVVVFVRQP